MDRLIDHLETLNRKERFFLIGKALGNPTFQLSPGFRAELSTSFSIQVPKEAFVAMDYHLDWIHASLVLLERPGDEGVYSNSELIVSGNQEDIDLLVAFDAGSTSHLVLLEAKAETGWTNKQMDSTADRFRRIFGERGQRYPEVTPHFALMSPRPPRELKTHVWPSWMTRNGNPEWIELKVPPGRRRLKRCDASGKPSATAGVFRVLTAR